MSRVSTLNQRLRLFANRFKFGLWIYKELRKAAIFFINFGRSPWGYFNFSRSNTHYEFFHVSSNPLVSIVIPTYNHADFLVQAIDSVLLQSHSNLEVIVVNDGSTDHTEKVLHQFLSDQRVRYLRQENRGLPHALNSGFALAKGHFYSWTSADNLLEKGAIKNLLSHICADNDAGLVFGDFEVIDEHGLPVGPESGWRIYDRDDKRNSIVRLRPSQGHFRNVPINFVGPYFLYRAQAARKLERYANVPGIEDWDYWLRMESFTKLKYVKSAETFYKYRIHKNSMTHKMNFDVNPFQNLDLHFSIVKKRMSSRKCEHLLDPKVAEELHAIVFRKQKGVQNESP